MDGAVYRCCEPDPGGIAELLRARLREGLILGEPDALFDLGPSRALLAAWTISLVGVMVSDPPSGISYSSRARK